jgi:NAD+ kinase
MSAPAGTKVRSAVLVTPDHDIPGVTEALGLVSTAAERASCALVEKEEGAELCIVLGGDGTILHALRRFVDTGVPVFAVNFGTIGFLSAVDRDQLEPGLERAFAGAFETVSLPCLEAETPGGRALAFNDITFSRQPQGPMAQLAYRLGGEEVGNVRCDGLVAATPAGSTGYNLANGGPILAWGVEGYAVSFIAPHTLTARALVVAPGDVLHVRNEASRGAVEVAFDGAHKTDLSEGEETEVHFRDGVGQLAQLPGANFYHRMREKFGRLAQ